MTKTSKNPSTVGNAQAAAWRDSSQFDVEFEQVLKNIWFLGDVHGKFSHIFDALEASLTPPRWLVFLGDVDIDKTPFKAVLAPVKKIYPDISFAFIHGNHDADSYEHWEMLHDCGDAAPLHGNVITIEGVRIAGLGGIFMSRVWRPPGLPSFEDKAKAMNRGRFQHKDGQRSNPSFNAAIYPADFALLGKQRADILVTHEAPSCHPFGFQALDELARRMRVVRTFHGHHHDDRSAEYASHQKSLGFDARAVNYCAIKNGLGEIVWTGLKVSQIDALS